MLVLQFYVFVPIYLYLCCLLNPIILLKNVSFRSDNFVLKTQRELNFIFLSSPVVTGQRQNLEYL